jgi:hypothetical protein
MNDVSDNRFIKLFFFGNYFYGLCAVALSIEAMLQQKYPLNGLLYFSLVFFSTVFYYSHAYVLTEVSEHSTNVRAAWYAQQAKLVFLSRLVFFTAIVGISLYFVFIFRINFLAISLYELLFIFIFPLVSLLYYGINHSFFKKLNLRNIGWLKPFIIGFIWAGLVTVYPVLFYNISKGTHYEISLVGSFLFIKNFMFITVLCIMFDIKDYAMDYNQQLKTFVVKLGLRKTILYIIIPLCIVGLAAFISYAFMQHFQVLKIILNTIPFVLTILVALSLYNRKSILYYLFIIDGLMIVKSICGITAMIYF